MQIIGGGGARPPIPTALYIYKIPNNMTRGHVWIMTTGHIDAAVLAISPNIRLGHMWIMTN